MDKYKIVHTNTLTHYYYLFLQSCYCSSLRLKLSMFSLLASLSTTINFIYLFQAFISFYDLICTYLPHFHIIMTSNVSIMP